MNPSQEYRGIDEVLPAYNQRTGNFMYGNYLFLLDELTDEKTYYAIADLTRFVTEESNAGKKLNIIINSCGGSVMLLNTIIGLLNTAKLADITIFTYVFGMAASAASVIAVQGDVRIMSRNALHFVHFGVIPQFLTKHTEISKSSKFANKLQQQAMDTYLNFCPNLTEEDYLKITEDEMGYLFSDDCMKYGFCDTILEDSLDEKLFNDAQAQEYYQKAVDLYKTEKRKTKKSKVTNKKSK